MRALAVFLASLSVFFAYDSGKQAPNQSVQSNTLTSPQTIRDPEAIQILSRSLSAVGITQQYQFVDFSASGNIVYNWAGEQVSGTAQVKCRGASQFRIDATLPVGSRSWYVSDGQGSIRNLDGTTTAIPLSSAANLGLLTAQHLGIVSLLADPSTSIAFAGATTFNSTPANKIHVGLNFTKWDPTSQSAPWSSRDYIVDSGSGLILAIQTVGSTADIPIRQFAYEVDFGNYQSVGGVLMPFTVTEKVGGQTTWALTFTSFQFNSGLSDSDFQFN